MTVAAPKPLKHATARSTGRRSLRAALTADAVAVGALGLWAAILLVATWGTWGDMTMDTGYDLLAASRTAHGELPYADFVYAYGPVGPLLLGGIYAITGAAVWPALALGVVLALTVIGLTYLVARLLVEPVAAGLASALVATLAFTSANNSYVLPHSTSAPLVTALTLGAILCLAPRDGAPAGRRPLGGGVLVGLALITRLELAVPLTVAVAAWLAFSAWRTPGDRAAIRVAAARVALPALAIPLVVYGALLTQVSPHELLYENLYPRSLFAQGGNVLLNAEAPLTLGSVVTLLGRFALYAACSATLVGAGWVASRGGTAGRAARIVLAVAALVVLALLLAKPETVRFYVKFAYLWVPAGAIAALLVLMRRAWTGSRGRQERVALLGAAILTAVTIKGYAAFDAYPNAKFPARVSVYLLPLAAPLLAYLHVRVLPALAATRDAGAERTVRVAGLGWLAALAIAGLGLTVRDAGAETDTVSGPHGTLTARPSQGPALQGALDAILAHTRPGEPILVAPQLTSLYVLSGRTDPLPQLSLLPGALADDAAQQQAIDAMGDVRLVVADRTPLRAYDQGAFGVTFDQRLAAWLHSEFRLLRTVKGDGSKPRLIDIWIRTSA